MKIVIAPDSFKESLSAQQVAETIKAGFEIHFPDAEYIAVPVADGGEGTLTTLIEAKKGQIFNANVEGPLRQTINARWGHFYDGSQSTAVIELAEASGIALNQVNERNVAIASTFGTGQLIKAALDYQVDRIILCLGGSATNDGGAGIAQALGIKLLDSRGREISRGGAALLTLDSIDISDLHPRATYVEWFVACDVSNPLCGENGASAVFGPQKGATNSQVMRLDTALKNFSDCVAHLTGHNHSETPGFGAAGGTPLAISLIRDPILKPGIDIVLEAVQLDHHLNNADLVITGEGQMDHQTLLGKAPFGVARLAKQLNIPTIGIAGSLGSDLTGLDCYFSAVFGTVRAPQSLEAVLEEAQYNLKTTASNIAATIKVNI
ncbi:glycerate kinase [Vibrio sp. RC27]